MAPRRGFKPRTLALTVRCSITELTRNFSIIILALPLSVLPRIAVSFILVGLDRFELSLFSVPNGMP